MAVTVDLKTTYKEDNEQAVLRFEIERAGGPLSGSGVRIDSSQVSSIFSAITAAGGTFPPESLSGSGAFIADNDITTVAACSAVYDSASGSIAIISATGFSAVFNAKFFATFVYET